VVFLRWMVLAKLGELIPIHHREHSCSAIAMLPPHVSMPRENRQQAGTSEIAPRALHVAVLNIMSKNSKQTGKSNRVDAVRRLQPLAEVVIVHQVDDEPRTLHRLTGLKVL
jgi:hypothetical protein